jgi:hypothetical protein
MNQTTLQQPDVEIGKAGIIDDDEQYDIDRLAPGNPVADGNEIKEVRIKCPQALPDQVVHLAWTIGMRTYQIVSAGQLIINFPAMGRHPKTNELVPTIGKFEMVVAKPEDIQRVVKLCTIINEQNMLIAAAQAKPTELLATSIEATQNKDEALRQLSQEAKGEVPLVIAKSAPPKGKIEIARR